MVLVAPTRIARIAEAPRLHPCAVTALAENAEWPKSLLFYFNAVPTDDQMRYLQEVMARAVACMPEDLR